MNLLAAFPGPLELLFDTSIVMCGLISFIAFSMFWLGLAEPEKTYVVTSNDKQKIRILLQINVLCTKLWFFSTINHPLNIKKLRRRSVSFFNNRKMSTKPNHYTTPLSILIHNGTLTYLWTASRLCGQVDTHQSGCTDVCLLEIVALFSTTHFDDTLLWP